MTNNKQCVIMTMFTSESLIKYKVLYLGANFQDLF